MTYILNTGWLLGCRDNTGGVQEIYIKSYSATASYTYDVNGQIATASVAESFYKFEQTSEVAEFTQEGQHSLENGTNFYNQNVNMVFHKYQSTLRDLIYILAQKEVLIIVKDQNNNYFMVGEQNGANLISSSANIGKSYGDMNGSTIGFQAKEPTPARQCSATYIASRTFI